MLNVVNEGNLSILPGQQLSVTELTSLRLNSTNYS